MKQKPNILDQAFDLLSSIPHLKKIMKGMWWFTLFFTPVAHIAGFLYGNADVVQEQLTIRTITSYIVGCAFFGYMFHLWDRRDRKRQSLSQE